MMREVIPGVCRSHRLKLLLKNLLMIRILLTSWERDIIRQETLLAMQQLLGGHMDLLGLALPDRHLPALVVRDLLAVRPGLGGAVGALLARRAPTAPPRPGRTASRSRTTSAGRCLSGSASPRRSMCPPRSCCIARSVSCLMMSRSQLVRRILIINKFLSNNFRRWLRQTPGITSLIIWQ